MLRVAQAGSLASTSDNSAPADATTADFIMSMRSVPSHPERRARQAILLAQRLLDMEKQRDALRAQVTDKTAAGVALQRQLDVAKEALARTSQVSFVEEGRRETRRIVLTAPHTPLTIPNHTTPNHTSTTPHHTVSPRSPPCTW